MGFEQDTLIYIEENDKTEASIAAKGFADNNTRNRAYINALGAELALKYLTSENINVSNIFNLHNIKKILEENDIADIMLPNIHIDVRVVFDENYIFIPKAHFEKGITPDIYLAFNLAKDFTHVKFLGFFEPKLINKNNANDEYYFIEKEKLSPVSDLKSYITNFKGNTSTNLSVDEMEHSERIMLSMIDNDISENDREYLIKQLTRSAELRDKFIEYENFELLSYKAMNDSQITKPDIFLEDAANISDFANTNYLNDITTDSENNNLEDVNIDDLINNNEQEDLKDEVIEDEVFSFDEIENPDAQENINDDDNDFNFDEIDTIEDTVISELDNDLEIENIIEETAQGNKDSSVLDDIAALGTAAAMGTGIGAGAAIAGEALSGLTNGIDAVDDALNIINNGIDVIGNLAEEKLQADFDTLTPEVNIDTQAEIHPFDEIGVTENNTEELNIIKDITETLDEVPDLSEIQDMNILEESEEMSEITDSVENVNMNDIEIPSIDKITEEKENTVSEIDSDGINLSELGEQLISTPPNNETIAPISLDEVDTSSLINEDEPEIEPEIISLDNVDTSNIHPEIDIDESMLDNKLSFDELNINSNEHEIPAQEEITDEIMSFDSVDTSNLIDTDFVEQQYSEEKISLDNVDTSDIHPEIDIDESLIDNKITLEEMGDINSNDNEIEELELIEDMDNVIDTNIAEELETYEEIDNIENNVAEPLNEEVATEFEELETDNSEISETIEANDKMSFDEFNNAANTVTNMDDVDDFMDDSMSFDDIETTDLEPLESFEQIQNEEDTQIQSDTFGNNIIDGLSNDGIDISTENSESVEEISSNDLLAEIDNILSTTDEPAIADAAKLDEAVNLSVDELLEAIPGSIPVNTNEIPTIDNLETENSINFSEISSEENQEKLGVLFDDNQNLDADDEDDEIANANNFDIPQEEPNTEIYQKTMVNEKGKKGIVVAAALVAVLLGVSGVAMFKSKSTPSNDIEPIAQNPAETENTNTINTAPSAETPMIPVEESNNNMLTNTPELDLNNTQPQPVKMSSAELKNTAIKKTKPQTSDAYLSVQRLVWEVPDNLSYSNGIKSYLRTAGKSIKLSLSSDLLLATEYAYTNQVKVDLKLSSNGTVQDAKVVSGSGSDQIDKIVLQSVKDTLNVVKPPSGEVKQPNFHLSLIIYL